MILTASHCLRGLEIILKPKLLEEGREYLGLGFGTGLDDDRSITEVAPGQTFEHPSAFHSASEPPEAVVPEHDIAYAILVDPPLGISPARVATESPTVGRCYASLGYGKTSGEEGASKARRTRPACVSPLTEGAATIETTTKHVSVCEGDSGGPLLAGDVVLGVLSQSLAQCLPGDGDATYASVVYNADFVALALSR